MRNASARKYRGVEVALSLCTGMITAKDLWKKIDLFVDVVQAARSLLDFSKDIRIVIRPIKGTVHGRFFGLSGMLEIDPRYNERQTVETLMHELVHAEQYKTGKLSSNGQHRLWNGVAFRPASNYTAYRNLPWEKEAFERSAGLTDQVLAIIGKSVTGAPRPDVPRSAAPAPIITPKVQAATKPYDPDSELRVDVREALLAEGKYSAIVIENLIAGDLMRQATRLGLI